MTNFELLFLFFQNIFIFFTHLDIIYLCKFFNNFKNKKTNNYK